MARPTETHVYDPIGKRPGTVAAVSQSGDLAGETRHPRQKSSKAASTSSRPLSWRRIWRRC